MRIEKTLLAAIGAALMTASPAAASSVDLYPQEVQDRDQDRAYNSARNGEAMPLPELKQRVIPRMPGYKYLNVELRGDLYRFKFVRDGRLVWVDVDPRTGRIVGSSGR
ncbi:PepSY domain-containing protein [Sphingomicrobium sediminis]|uniref:PepSY domain-containing protein n=1 Tax=Sphingomicrobium sediminis TaxID=2950949 RepID=A0A9X2EF47_9SPHN|nr:PepSY domain-containing protein [Sphingomicrobium sediminis]MCM8556266.1 PepSY domain-containing protein [Sphingomicrobium sediminis]